MHTYTHTHTVWGNDDRECEEENEIIKNTQQKLCQQLFWGTDMAYERERDRELSGGYHNVLFSMECSVVNYWPYENAKIWDSIALKTYI